MCLPQRGVDYIQSRNKKYAYGKKIRLCTRIDEALITLKPIF